MFGAIDLQDPLNTSHQQAIGLKCMFLAHPAFMQGGMAWLDVVSRQAGVLNGMTWPATLTSGLGVGTSRGGGQGEARCDSGNDYVDFGAKTYLVAGSPFTLSWWENITADTNVYNGRFVLLISGNANKFLVLRPNATASAFYRSLAFGINSGAAVVDVAAPSVTSSISKWNHFVITGSDPSSVTPGNYTVAINGQPLTPGTSLSGFGAVTRTQNTIGDYGTAGATAFFDDVRIYDRRMPANDIYLESALGCPNLINWADEEDQQMLWMPGVVTPSTTMLRRLLVQVGL